MLKAKAFNIGADWGSLSDSNVYVSDIVVPNKTLALPLPVPTTSLSSRRPKPPLPPPARSWPWPS